MAAAGADPSKLITEEELSTHKSMKDCWMAIHGNVYDVTKFLVAHPGGDSVMLEHSGIDATDGFENVGHRRGSPRGRGGWAREKCFLFSYLAEAGISPT